MKPFRRKPSRRAVILVLTLWMVIVLSLLAQSLAFEMLVEMKLSGAHRDLFLAEQTARIGIARAVMDLRNDMLLTDKENAVWNEQFDALGDVWAGGETVPRSFPVTVAGERNPVGEYSLLVVDEESKFPLNAMNPDWRKAMKYLLVQLDVAETEADRIAAALWDWKDPDNLSSAGEGENEIAFYSKLQEENLREGEDPRSLYPKNAPFETVEEVLQVPGVTPEIFYGGDPKKKTEPGFFPTQPGERERPGLRDLLTVRASASNVNTLRAECLAAIFAAAADNLETGQSLAENVIERRQRGRESRIDNTDAFRNIAQLGLVQGMSAPLMANAKKVVLLTTQSQFFTVYCEARYGRRAARALNSRTWGREERPLPTARVLATCKRAFIPQVRQGEGGWVLPGCKTKEMTTAGGLVIANYVVPVVYFLDWNEL